MTANGQHSLKLDISKELFFENFDDPDIKGKENHDIHCAGRSAKSIYRLWNRNIRIITGRNEQGNWSLYGELQGPGNAVPAFREGTKREIPGTGRKASRSKEKAFRAGTVKERRKASERYKNTE